jgi:hypothetical protein
MRDAIIIIVVLLLLLLLISIFGGSLRYTPSAETFYQSVDDEGAEDQDEGAEEGAEGAPAMDMEDMGMPMPDDAQIDTFAQLQEDNEGAERNVPSGELSPMMMSETFQQAGNSASQAMAKILGKTGGPTTEASKKVEAFQDGGHFAAF